MNRTRLEALLGRLPALRITVVGDLFLDRYWMIDPALDEPSLETGLTAWQVVDTRLSPGAAGTVLNNLSALGIGTLRCISLLGEDGEAWALRRLLGSQGVDLSGCAASDAIRTPFYTKPMFRQADGSWQEGHRIDRKSLRPTPAALEARLLSAMREAAAVSDAIILLDQVSDEDTGVVTRGVRQLAAQLLREHPGLLIVADSRALIHLFHGVGIKCNDREASVMTGQQPHEGFDQARVFASLRALQQRTEQPVFVTCNKHGIAVMDGPEPALLPAAVQTGPIDVVGAGDASTAGIVSALCAGATRVEAAAFANLCAGVTVRKLGTTGTASPQEVLAIHAEMAALS